MTLLKLDQYIDNYIHRLQLKKAIKGMNNIAYQVKHSKKSKSLYLSLSLFICNNNYKRTIRISDHFLDNQHTRSHKFKGVLVAPNRNIGSNKLKKLESYISKQIIKLLNDAPRHAIYTFKAN
ncbi:hypothetical protein [Mariniplasma anaerobium]|uniref:Uncharacterized protein n=1 Tax=Mariniplasma anaerobium TaxID=2735436 RepID=A0A7U9TH96_9MOLU|nr:hypothetical protein [Mariniplasma anaerobium]BCR35205.1 hypothetical protein MPAN_000980 [Mariniplasma anaerobium]